MIPENTVISTIEQMVNFVPCSRMRSSNPDPRMDQSCNSPPTSVDAYLVDPLDNCGDVTGDPELCLRQSAEPAPDVHADFVSCDGDQLNCHEEDFLQALDFASVDMIEQSISTGLPDLNSDQATPLQETFEEVTLSNVKACVNNKAAICSSSSYPIEGEPDGEDPSVLVHEGENNFQQLDRAVEVDESLDTHLKSASKDVSVGVDSSGMPASSTQVAWSTIDCDVTGHTFFMTKDDVVPHGKETFEWDGLNSSPKLQPESLQIILAGDSHLDASNAVSNTSSDNQSPFDQEDGVQNQRGMRKRLQFEAVEHHRVSPRFSSKVGNSVQNKGTSSVTAPRTLGIGLHLNSIGGPITISANMLLPENDASIRGKNLLPGCNDQEQESRKFCVATRSLAEHQSFQLPTSSDSPHSASEKSEGKQQNEATNSSYQSSLVKPLSRSVQLMPVDRYITPCSVKKRPSEDAMKTESSQSPRKKRKKSDSEGCKRCSCKRSKCLKLYCDCFAAGVFCSDACACQECYNKPEHENTVRETRQLIESRNPLAFAPKVVVHSTNAPKVTGDSELVTPSSARHKRGCNCKKSLCLKRYCECFQAGVGCSLGCRCEGCRNTFGRKDGNEAIETQQENKEIVLERDPYGTLEASEFNKQIISIEHCSLRLTPLTPFFQGSEKDEGKSQLPAKYYPSPESGASVSPSFETPNSPIDSSSSSIFAKETEGTLSLVPDNQDLRSHPVLADSFSPGWDRFPDICNFSPLGNPSPLGSSPSAAPKSREPKALHAKLFAGSGRLSISSNRWRNSPVTPLPQLGEGKFVIGPDTDSGMHPNHDDETPEILKDTCSPIVAVKASSPNQKRVSPPHKHLNEMRSSLSSSPATRSGRKFILQSVPSFPPLTPYINNTRRNDT